MLPRKQTVVAEVSGETYYQKCDKKWSRKTATDVITSQIKGERRKKRDTVQAEYLCVTDTLSAPTNTKPPSEECQDVLISCQVECMCSFLCPLGGQNLQAFKLGY